MQWDDGLFSKVILMKDWHTIWLAFAISLVIAVAFAVLFAQTQSYRC
jgi:NHS family xanthosine MFS transporter